jgi:hypothetical protein
MISIILNRKSSVFWLLFHVALGVASILTPWVLIAWFYLVLVTTGPKLIRRTEGTFVPLVLLIAYTTSFELIARMSGTSPFIPYELGKYLLFVLLVFGVLKGYRKGYIGWLMLILLLPAAFFDLAGETTLKNIVFNLIGPVNVALAVIFLRKEEIKQNDFIDTMRLMFYPLVSVLAFTIIKSPDLETIEFTLGANFETSGGFGTNQVSTALGLGAFLAFLFWWYRWKLTGFRWLDIMIFIAFVFRGLLTFSRGGMFGVALGILTMLIFSQRHVFTVTAFRPVKTIMLALPLVILMIFTFVYANRITKGQLSLRYQGETGSTLRGTKEKDFNTFTSNRLMIFQDDLKLWKKYPVLGVGVGASSHMRESSKEFLSHIEFSRLLAEHGIPGLIYTMILFALGFNLYRQRKNEKYSAVLLALFIVAIFTTFHAAMRTYISPLLIGLSMLSIVDQDFEELTD